MSTASILVVDDEPEIRGILQEILQDEDYAVTTADSAARAREMYRKVRPDLVLLDIWMPDLDGISLLKEWMQGGHRAAVVMMSGHGNVETAVEAVQLGAQDFIEKPLSTGRLLSTVARVLEQSAVDGRAEHTRGAAATLVGKNPLIEALRQQIDRAAQHDAPVLFAGEYGSGKGVAARYLHQRSRQRDQVLREFNLAAMPPEEIAAQLFEDQSVLVSNGVVLLKEIDELDLGLQARLLQAMSDNAGLRVLATTGQDLRERVTEGSFREDLFYRLSVLFLKLPALREHRDDVPELIRFFVDRLVEEERLGYRRFSSAALNALRNYSWPGNVRELKNLVRRLLILRREGEVDLEEVEQAIKSSEAPEGEAIPESLFTMPLRAARDRFEKAYLQYHLKRTGGNVSEVANFVEMERTHLYRKLKGLGINPKSTKDE